jgi:hypothetical protein
MFLFAGVLGIAALLVAAFPNLALLIGANMPDKERSACDLRRNLRAAGLMVRDGTPPV